MFSSEAACAEYLHWLHWPNGFRCPECNGSKAWVMARGHFHCTQCQRQTSLTAGTIFEGTRKPLTTWFHAQLGLK